VLALARRPVRPTAARAPAGPGAACGGGFLRSADGPGGGQPEREDRPLAGLALEREVAAREPGEAPAYRKAESGSALRARVRIVHLIERIEHPRLLLGGDADTVVLNANEGPRPLSEQLGRGRSFLHDAATYG